MPRRLGAQNKRDVPATALLATSALTQLFLLSTMFSDDAFALHPGADQRAVPRSPICWPPAFAVKLHGRPQGRRACRQRAPQGSDRRRSRHALYGVPALRRGPEVPAALVSDLCAGHAALLRARREQGRRVFSTRERLLFAATVAGAIFAVVALSAGWVGINQGRSQRIDQRRRPAFALRLRRGRAPGCRS